MKVVTLQLLLQLHRLLRNYCVELYTNKLHYKKSEYISRNTQFIKTEPGSAGKT